MNKEKDEWRGRGRETEKRRSERKRNGEKEEWRERGMERNRKRVEEEWSGTDDPSVLLYIYAVLL